MALLTNSDFAELRSAIYQQGRGKEEMKALPNLPSKSQLLAVFQGIENFWEDNKATLKASIDAAYGQITTASLSKKIMVVWLQWKIKQ